MITAATPNMERSLGDAVISIVLPMAPGPGLSPFEQLNRWAILHSKAFADL